MAFLNRPRPRSRPRARRETPENRGRGRERGRGRRKVHRVKRVRPSGIIGETELDAALPPARETRESAISHAFLKNSFPPRVFKGGSIFAF